MDTTIFAANRRKATMKNLEYITAKDFDRAWFNFELDLPLKPDKNGNSNPFYVDRPGNPIAELKDALMAPFYRPPKFFFSGHRGCGKSTELQHLLSSADLRRKYWPIHFSIRDETDYLDLDFRDVLLAIGSKLFREYKNRGGELPDQLLRELNSWKGRMEKEISTILEGRASSELSGSVDTFFVNAGLKLKLEPATRVVLRQVIETDITGLIAIINHISTAIFSQERLIPLIIIDDMDKPPLEKARAIFHDCREIMMQPNCAIVYTVSSALFYSKEFDAIRDQAIFLPNIHLHPPKQPDVHDVLGYETLKEFVRVRMDSSLIDEDALDLAVTYGGGVFREMARVMRTSIGRARRRKACKVEVGDVEATATEMRNEFRRILDPQDIKLLKKIMEGNRLENSERMTDLMQILAVLEYRNGENWCDVHPVLRKLLHD